jgi:succinate dehydrogenase/fumarate reductase-like Fe-S protein
MSDSQSISTIRIRRFDPESMPEPRYQMFEVPYAEGLTVMDAILYIYRQLDSSLAFRAFCQVGLCYGCLIQIDGKAKCPCKTYMRRQMTLEPLGNRKVLRDLVVELD